MPEILVIRHSTAVANEQGILMGSKLDSPLSPKGLAIAKQKGQELLAQGFKPDTVYTSELKRSQQTAEAILAELGVKAQVQPLAALNERDFGEHDGKLYASVIQAFETYGPNPPTIEPVPDFIARVSGAWELVVKNTTGSTLVVTHSNPEMVLQTLTENPDSIEQFWALGDPAYCEGFKYTF